MDFTNNECLKSNKLITHVGELLLSRLKDCPDQNRINQIDAYTGEEETFASFLKRSVALAKCLRKFGAKPGDVLAVAGRNNIHVHVASYAAVYNGLPLVGVDPFFKYGKFNNKQNDTVFFNLSPLQWASSYFNAVSSTLLHFTRLQISGPQSTDRIVNAINKYKPTGLMCTAAIINQLINYKGECDLTCFKTITTGGCKVQPQEIIKIKKRSNAQIVEYYGQTETVGPVFVPVPETPIGSVGRPFPRVEIKLVDPETEEVIDEPYKNGHLLVKGPRFTEYYNNPKATAEAFTDDGYYKTGDLLYRDENNYYYFVERIKMLIKFMNYHILPPDLEEAIRSHEGVQDAVVVGLPYKEYSEIPVACVIRKAGSNVTAQEIKDIIANKFSDANNLRGGVVFMDEFIMTSTGKIARHKLRDYCMTVNRE